MSLSASLRSLAAFAAVASLSPRAVGAGGAVLQRVVVDSAKCLDGSPYSFYIAVGAQATGFFLYHQGGSWCFSPAECAQRANSSLGSSTTWPQQQTMGDGMDTDPAVNPLMANWTKVYLPYCDGGSFTGDATGTAPDGTALTWNGLKIRQGVVAELRASFGFDRATDLVVGGGSAGGIAAYLHADFYAAALPAGARAIAMPDSGYFEDGNNDRDGKGDYDLNMQNLYAFQNSAAGIYSAACTAALGYKCMFAYHLIPFIKTRILALNSAYDATMGAGECGAGSGITLDWSNATSVNLCGNYVRAGLKQRLAAPSAVFLDSCHHHCGEWNSITIEGLLCSRALFVFYTQGAAALPNGGYMDQGHAYPCNACCSP